MASKLFVFIMFLCLSEFSTAQVENSTINKNARIVGGKLAHLKQFPFVACLKLKLISDARSHTLCTGSIITDRWVLSAAHCDKDGIVYKKSKAIAGVTNCQQKDKAQERIIERNVRYEKWDLKIPPNNDIALFKVNNPFVFNSYVSPIKLAKNPFPSASVLGCTSMGYGQGADGKSDQSLNYVQTRGGGGSFCEETGFIRKPFLVESFICLKPFRSGESVCGGDSGGPLVCQGLLAGVVHGWITLKPGLKCGDLENIQVYSFPGYFESWIRKHVANLPESKLLAGKYSRSRTRNLGRGIAYDQSTSGISRSTNRISIVILAISCMFWQIKG